MVPSRLISSLFSDLPRISTIEHHAAIGSTNDRARELAARGTPEIALVVADEQLSGRGRQGRSWYTPPGTALAFSLLIRPVIAAHQAMRLTMLAGLAAVDGIEWATGLRLALKWPNDVVIVFDHHLAAEATDPSGPLHNRPPALRKIGGILTECAFQGDHIEHAVIGIGLNVNVDFSQQTELRSIATSLMHLAGREIDRWAVLKAVVAAWLDRYAWLGAESAPSAEATAGTDPAPANAHADRLQAAWAARLINLRRHIRVKLNDQVLEGYAEGVDHDGALLVRTGDHQVRRLLSGDVTLHDLNR